MSTAPAIRPAQSSDYPQWKVLWDGYNEHDARLGDRVLAEKITAMTWARILDPAEPIRALVASMNAELSGFAHAVFHRSTSRRGDVCYLQDLFVTPAHRRRGIGRGLIQAVFEEARRARSERVYWSTYTDNSEARALYDTVASRKGLVVYSCDLQ